MESELIEMAPEGYKVLPRRDQPRLLSCHGRISETRWIRADTLRRDAEYNRTIRPFRVDAIRRAFNADGLGLIYVSERKDGQCYIIDGQHRHQAVMDLGMGHCDVLCAVYRHLTQDEERTIFLLLNRERLPLSAQEAFAARAASGEGLAGSMKDLLAAHGIRLVQNRKPGVREIASVSVLEEIDQRFGEAMLDRVLAVFGTGWPEQPGIYRRQWLMAAASVLADGLDDARLMLALTGCPPADLNAMVMGTLQQPNYTGWAKYADAMREVYAGVGE
jgi:hypothetical protein